MAFQRDFKALFNMLKSIHATKEQWRGRVLDILARQ